VEIHLKGVLLITNRGFVLQFEQFWMLSQNMEF
jgi:hypothetical protein